MGSENGGTEYLKNDPFYMHFEAQNNYSKSNDWMTGPSSGSLRDGT